MAVPNSNNNNSVENLVISCVDCKKSNCKYTFKNNDQDKEKKYYVECMDCNKKFTVIIFKGSNQNN
jgi:hypothetical protein